MPYMLNEVEGICKQFWLVTEWKQFVSEKLVKKENDLHFVKMFHPDK